MNDEKLNEATEFFKEMYGVGYEIAKTVCKGFGDTSLDSARNYATKAFLENNERYFLKIIDIYHEENPDE